MPVQLQDAIVIKHLSCTLIPNAAGAYADPNELSVLPDAAFSGAFSLNVVAQANMAAPANKTAVSGANMAAPRIANAASAATMAAARFVAPKAYSDLPPFPLTHPRILYQSVLAGATATATAGFNPAFVLNPNTWQRYFITGVGVLTITLPSTQTMDCIALGGTNGANTVGSFRVSYSGATSGAFTLIGSQQSNDAGAHMFFISSPVPVRRIQIEIINNAGLQQFIGTVYAGIALQMQRPIYGGVNPITLNRVTDYFNNQSESGNWLGRQIRRRGFESSLGFERLTAPWYRQYFDPFVRSARTLPFFFAWRPSDFPLEVAYCWTDGDIQPSNSGGGNNYMSVSFGVKAAG